MRVVGSEQEYLFMVKICGCFNTDDSLKIVLLTASQCSNIITSAKKYLRKGKSFPTDTNECQRDTDEWR